MIFALTTGQCAEFLNDVVEMRAYTSDYILGQIREGLIRATVDKGTRRRSRVRIHPRDFRAYLCQYYPAYVTRFDSEFTANNEIAS